MKIGIEGRTLQGHRYGVARILLNTLRILPGIDMENRYILYTSGPVEDAGLPETIELKTIHMKPGILWRHLRLPLAMAKDGVDLHFSPSYFVPLLKVCPNIVSVFDITFKVHPEWFTESKRFKFDNIFWSKVKRAECILTCSQYSKKDIVRILEVPESKVKVLYPAADEIFKPVNDKNRIQAIKEKYGIAGEFILTVGAIHTRRNLEKLIEAFAIADGKLDTNPELFILGEKAPFSPDVDIEGTAKRFGVEDRIIRAEYVPEEDLLLLYNACDLFVYPSLYEGFGLPVIEAMSCGTPVACSNVTSIPEVAGDAAIYFDPANTGEIADAIVLGVTDVTIREQCSRLGLEQSMKFSWQRSAMELLDIFNEVAGRD